MKFLKACIWKCHGECVNIYGAAISGAVGKKNGQEGMSEIMSINWWKHKIYVYSSFQVSEVEIL